MFKLGQRRSPSTTEALKLAASGWLEVERDDLITFLERLGREIHSHAAQADDAKAHVLSPCIGRENDSLPRIKFELGRGRMAFAVRG